MALRKTLSYCLVRQMKNVTAAPTRHQSTSLNLKEAIATVIPEKKEFIREFRSKYDDQKVGDVTINMMYHGMRGIHGLVYEISDIHRDGGIQFRGYGVERCRELLPKAPGGEEPLPEAMFWLLCTGQIPTQEQAEAVSKEWVHRAHLPSHVKTMLERFPSNVNAMTQFSAAVTACNSESKFNTAYHAGISKEAYWEYMYEDAMDLIAKLPTIAAIIYRNLYRDDSTLCPIDPHKDWAWNYASMMGYDIPKLREFLRLYLSVNSEHGGSSVCSHTGRLVGSALSDVYLAFSSGLAGLAGPRHGGANQEAVLYLIKAQKDLGTNYTVDQLKDYLWNSINTGKLIPGFGHAVLRRTDPRYTAHHDFLQQFIPEDPLFRLASDLYKLVPGVLKEHGRVRNPWPNVHAISGVGLCHYGITEIDYHPLFVGLSRSLGSMASLIWDRILKMPIERPKSMSTENLKKMVMDKQFMTESRI